ncbi:MAG: helix-turn-helix transcriptional regulator [Bacteroidales bacterium]|nr:helix-turn-helix transcriptional regulator [Bacteroidales bacterium]
MDEQKKREVNRNIPINPNRTPSKRMRPAVDLLIDENISIAELAAKMGMSRSSLNRWYQIDDARLSGLEEMAKALGYHVEWKFVKD